MLFFFLPLLTGLLVFGNKAHVRIFLFRSEIIELAGIYNTVHTIRTHSDKVIGLSLHATTDYLATASADQTWALHSVDTGACLLKRSFAAEEPKAS